MTPFIILTAVSFLAFVAWVESYPILESFKQSKHHLLNTMGRADWVYPNIREHKSYMRRNVVQTYGGAN